MFNDSEVTASNILLEVCLHGLFTPVNRHLLMLGLDVMLLRNVCLQVGFVDSGLKCLATGTAESAEKTEARDSRDDDLWWG